MKKVDFLHDCCCFCEHCAIEIVEQDTLFYCSLQDVYVSFDDVCGNFENYFEV